MQRRNAIDTRRQARSGLGNVVGGGGTPAFTTGIIDDVIAAGAAAPMRALHCKRLYSAYSSNLIRVRSAGGGEADIGANADGTLNTADVINLCGANDGFVVTWYDQSGNARDHTETDAAQQPKIYDGATTTVLTYGVAQNPAPNFTRASAQSLARAGWLNTASDYTGFWGGAGGTTGTQTWMAHDNLRLGTATANKIIYLSGGGVNRQFTPVTAVTTVGSYLCSFLAADLHTTIGIEQNGTALAQASVAGAATAIAFTTTSAAVGSQSNGSANAQNGPLIWAMDWSAALTAPQLQLLRDWGADNI